VYKGYLVRRDDGTYVPGREVSNRYRELAVAYRGPVAMGFTLRRAATETAYTHLLARLVGGQAAITAVAYGLRSPFVEEFSPGVHQAAHATAWGQALLATLTPDERLRYGKDHGLAAMTARTLVAPEASEQVIALQQPRGLHSESGPHRGDVASAAILLLPHVVAEHRPVLGCVLPAGQLGHSLRRVGARLRA
jgi:DNA-binding IclR family transcriptional regulator